VTRQRGAADSHAPHGARLDWLPSNEWVLAHALVAPRLKAVRPAMRPVLERRALDTLTQAHLSNHVIFHVFHTPAIAERAKTVFGLRPATFRRLRDSGLSPARIAERGGRTRAGAQARLAALLNAPGRRAVQLRPH
jgi:hypothetical protein